MYYVIEIIRVFTVCIIVLGRIKRWREYNPILEGKPPPILFDQTLVTDRRAQDAIDP